MKRTALNKVRKTTKGALMRKADKIFSEKIRSKGYCELNGLDKIQCGGVLQTMHIISRSNKNLRWDPINALCGCAGHHSYYTYNPFEFYELIRAEFSDRYEYLQRYRNQLWDKDYDRVLNELLDWKPL